MPNSIRLQDSNGKDQVVIDLETGVASFPGAGPGKLKENRLRKRAAEFWDAIATAWRVGKNGRFNDFRIAGTTVPEGEVAGDVIVQPTSNEIREGWSAPSITIMPPTGEPPSLIQWRASCFTYTVIPARPDNGGMKCGDRTHEVAPGFPRRNNKEHHMLDIRRGSVHWDWTESCLTLSIKGPDTGWTRLAKFAEAIHADELPGLLDQRQWWISLRHPEALTFKEMVGPKVEYAKIKLTLGHTYTADLGHHPIEIESHPSTFTINSRR